MTETKYKLGIQSQWYNNDKTLIVTEISGSWNWDDVNANLEQIVAMAASVDYPLGLIVLVPNDVSIPPTGFAQASRRAANAHAQAAFHSIVYVIENYGLKTLWAESIPVFAQDPSRYHIVNNFDEALDLMS